MAQPDPCWFVIKWLLSGLMTTLVSGAGFLFMTMAVEYAKVYYRKKLARAKAIRDLLDTKLEWSPGHELLYTELSRRRIRHSNGAEIFEAYKRSSGFLSNTNPPKRKAYIFNPSNQVESSSSDVDPLAPNINEYKGNPGTSTNSEFSFHFEPDGKPGFESPQISPSASVFHRLYINALRRSKEKVLNHQKRHDPVKGCEYCPNCALRSQGIMLWSPCYSDVLQGSRMQHESSQPSPFCEECHDNLPQCALLRSSMNNNFLIEFTNRSGQMPQNRNLCRGFERGSWPQSRRPGIRKESESDDNSQPCGSGNVSGQTRPKAGKTPSVNLQNKREENQRSLTNTCPSNFGTKNKNPVVTINNASKITGIRHNGKTDQIAQSRKAKRNRNKSVTGRYGLPESLQYFDELISNSADASPVGFPETFSERKGVARKPTIDVDTGSDKAISGMKTSVKNMGSHETKFFKKKSKAVASLKLRNRGKSTDISEREMKGTVPFQRDPSSSNDLKADTKELEDAIGSDQNKYDFVFTESGLAQSDQTKKGHPIKETANIVLANLDEKENNTTVKSNVLKEGKNLIIGNQKLKTAKEKSETRVQKRDATKILKQTGDEVEAQTPKSAKKKPPGIENRQTKTGLSQKAMKRRADETSHSEHTTKKKPGSNEQKKMTEANKLQLSNGNKMQNEAQMKGPLAKLTGEPMRVRIKRFTVTRGKTRRNNALNFMKAVTKKQRKTKCTELTNLQEIFESSNPEKGSKAPSPPLPEVQRKNHPKQKVNATTNKASQPSMSQAPKRKPPTQMSTSSTLHRELLNDHDVAEYINNRKANGGNKEPLRRRKSKSAEVVLDIENRRASEPLDLANFPKNTEAIQSKHFKIPAFGKEIAKDMSNLNIFPTQCGTTSKIRGFKGDPSSGLKKLGQKNGATMTQDVPRVTLLSTDEAWPHTLEEVIQPVNKPDLDSNAYLGPKEFGEKSSETTLKCVSNNHLLANGGEVLKTPKLIINSSANATSYRSNASLSSEKFKFGQKKGATTSDSITYSNFSTTSEGVLNIPELVTPSRNSPTFGGKASISLQKYGRENFTTAFECMLCVNPSSTTERELKTSESGTSSDNVSIFGSNASFDIKDFNQIKGTSEVTAISDVNYPITFKDMFQTPKDATYLTDVPIHDSKSLFGKTYFGSRENVFLKTDKLLHKEKILPSPNSPGFGNVALLNINNFGQRKMGWTKSTNYQDFLNCTSFAKYRDQGENSMDD